VMLGRSLFKMVVVVSASGRVLLLQLYMLAVVFELTHSRVSLLGDLSLLELGFLELKSLLIIQMLNQII